MSLYSDRVLPWIMERVLSLPRYHAQRIGLLRRAAGEVLEIGFGFGATVAAYPAGPGAVARLWGVDPSRGMVRRAARRIAAAPFPVHRIRAGAEALPFRDASFDTVVSNWTLCTVDDLHGALGEARRVLRPGGLFLFLEHGLADAPRLARWQVRLTPLQRRIAGGCRLDRGIDAAIRNAGFRIETLERYEAGYGPRALRQMYRGAARPA